MTKGPWITREEAIRRAGDHLADEVLAIQHLTPREQAEASWTPTSRYSVDELEDLIRAERGYPPKGGAAGEVRHHDGE